MDPIEYFVIAIGFLSIGLFVGFMFGIIHGITINKSSIKELEKIKKEIDEKRNNLVNKKLNEYTKCKIQGYSDSMGIIDKHISKLAKKNTENK